MARPLACVLGALAGLVVLSSSAAAQDAAALTAPGIPDDAELLDAWRSEDWDVAQPLANALRAERPGDARARVVNAAVRLRLPAGPVLRLDPPRLELALAEIHRIEAQRTAAEVVGALSAVFGTAGLAVALAATSFDRETFLSGGMGFAIGGGTTGAIAVVAAVAALVAVLDVPARWQRWAQAVLAF